MTHDELLAEIDTLEARYTDYPTYLALRAVVELHKPYDSKDTPHELAMGWCKGCSIEYSIKEYASQPYPCPTIQAIEEQLK